MGEGISAHAKKQLGECQDGLHTAGSTLGHAVVSGSASASHEGKVSQLLGVEDPVTCERQVSWILERAARLPQNCRMVRVSVNLS